MVPTMWHDKPSYGHPVYDPVWAACADGRPRGAHPLRRGRLGQLQRQHRPVRARGAVLDPPDPVAAAAVGEVRPVPRPQVRRGRVRLVLAGRPAVEGRHHASVPTAKVKKLQLPDQGPHPEAAVGVPRHQRVHRRVHHESRGDPSPPRQRHRRPDVGHRLPAPRRLVAPHRRAARDRLPGGVDRGHPTAARPQRRASATTSTSPALAEIAARVGPTPREARTRTPNLRTTPDAIREARWWFDDYGIEWKG